MVLKVLHSISQQIWKTRQWPQDWKKSVFIPVLKKSSAKECSDTRQLRSLPMLVRLCSKSFKLGLSSTWIKNFQMCKLGLEKAEESENNLECIYLTFSWVSVNIPNIDYINRRHNCSFGNLINWVNKTRLNMGRAIIQTIGDWMER